MKPLSRIIPLGGLLLLGWLPSARAQQYWTLDGTYNPTFNASGGGTYVTCHARMPDGRILYGGNFDTASGTALPNPGGYNLALINNDGSVDSSFAIKLNAGDSVAALAVQSDGHVYMVGKYHGNPGKIRINTDGTISYAFGTFGTQYPIMAVDDQGRLYLSEFYGPLTRYLADGTVDSTFSTSIVPSVVQPLANGKSIVLNYSTSVATRLTATGSVEQTFNDHLLPINTICALADGGICALSGNVGVLSYLMHYTAAGVVDLRIDVTYMTVDESAGLPFDEMTATGTSFARFTSATGVDEFVESSGKATWPNGASSPYRYVKSNLSGPSYSAAPQVDLYEGGYFEGLLGGGASLNFAAVGLEPFTFQWYENGNVIPGATSNSLSFSNLTYENAGYYTVVATNPDGSTTSLPVQLEVVGAPVIATQPENTTVAVGQQVSLSAGVVGDPQPTFQWYDGGAAVPGATSSTLILSSAQLTDAGSYSLTATNSYGSVTSIPAVVTVFSPSSGPTITIQPVSQTVDATANASFSVTASGPGTVTYQWFFGGQPIAGATGPTFSIATAGRSNAGTYYVQVTANSISVQSAQVSLTVLASQLINLSTRGYVGSGANILIGGYSVAGTGSKSIVARAIGPGLQAFGIGSPLESTILTMFDSNGLVISSDAGWTDMPAVGPSPVQAVTAEATATEFQTVGAFALQTGSADSAMAVSLPAGNSYTAQVSGTGDETGTALVEIYDLNPTAANARLINISSRALVGTGTQNMIAGFGISGPAPERVLIRAIGPGLAQFGLTGVLATPQLTLHDSTGASIATATGWGKAPTPGSSTVQTVLAPATEEIFSSVGAFALASGSADCAMVATLQPGSTYTAEVDGLSGTTGIALVEIYEIP